MILGSQNGYPANQSTWSVANVKEILAKYKNIDSI